jgi:hypothetical protein
LLPDFPQITLALDTRFFISASPPQAQLTPLETIAVDNYSHDYTIAITIL